MIRKCQNTPPIELQILIHAQRPRRCVKSVLEEVCINHSVQTSPELKFERITTLSLSLGHFTYECKNSRPYVSRPSRTQQLEKPGVLAKMRAEGKPSVEVPEEFKKKCAQVDFLL